MSLMSKRAEERYAGDEAWKHWFEMCAVNRCTNDEQMLLKQQVESAFMRELLRYRNLGVMTEDYASEDICSLFDAFFYLHGITDNPKPLKAYYCDRIDPADLDGLKKIVCGTFFSPRRGRIKDIVRETITLVKGWKIRWVTTDDGKKKPEWCELPLNPPPESVTEEDLDRRMPVCNDDAFAVLCRKKESWVQSARNMMNEFCGQSEKSSREVPILMYTILRGVSPSSTNLQKLLGVRQVQTYKKVTGMKELMRDWFVRNQIVQADTGIIPALRDEVDRRIDQGVVELLNNDIDEELR